MASTVPRVPLRIPRSGSVSPKRTRSRGGFLLPIDRRQGDVGGRQPSFRPQQVADHRIQPRGIGVAARDDQHAARAAAD